MDPDQLLSNEIQTPFGQLIPTIVLLALIFVVGTIGNILVLLVYQRRRGSESDNETDCFFINSLALSDLIVCLIIVPCTIVIEWSSFHISYYFCKIYYLINMANLLFSTMLTALIAVDRCLCILLPLRKILTVHAAKITTLTILSSSIVIGIMGATLVDMNPHIHNVTNFLNTAVCEEIKFKKNVNFLFIIYYKVIEKTTYSIFILSIIIVIICYCLVYVEIIKIRRREKSMLFQHQQDWLTGKSVDLNTSDVYSSPGEQALLTPRKSMPQSLRESALFRNIKSAAILFVVALVYILAFTPVLLIITFQVIDLNVILYNLYYINNAANPIVYCFMNSIFRRDLRRLVARHFPSCTKKQKTSFYFKPRAARTSLGESLSPETTVEIPRTDEIKRQPK